ncbi:rhodanese-like domain-containing protein [Oceanibium sediminis]|uniref:rhodanese-like domain-containing protein n=1 Tax=Oceanibium sediminis TaxID=2026339 RepID=UPI000DD41463|nr:rhodanese-like domain-containing protein [Oceanibium sediminis]
MIATEPKVTECTPQEAWQGLEKDGSAQLIDVRTRPEWGFVGIPDISALGRQVILHEWRQFPQMTVNPAFVDEVIDSLGGTPPRTLFFICRSGARSMEAAHAVAAGCAARGHDVTCVNVAEGFEGDLDGNRHRGKNNGWKARGLSWQQG